jgi:hypothetical protein
VKLNPSRVPPGQKKSRIKKEPIKILYKMENISASAKGLHL